MSDSLDQMIEHLRTILAILVLAGWTDEEIRTLANRQLEIAHQDPEAAAPVLRA